MPAGSPSPGRTSPAPRRCQAATSGSRMVFQELSDAPPLTVTENICLGRWPTRRGRVDWRPPDEQAVARARHAWGRTSTPTGRSARCASASVRSSRSPGRCRATTRCLILDEPTAALSAGESDRLFEIVLRLRTAGVAIIYITHRLDEVRQIADRVQVLRDGATVLEGAVADHDRGALVEAMVGRSRRPDPASRGDAPRERTSRRSSGSATSRRIGVRRRQPRPARRRDRRAVRTRRAGHPGGRRGDLRGSRARRPARSSSADGVVDQRPGRRDPQRDRTGPGRPSARWCVDEPTGRREPVRRQLAVAGPARRHHRQRDRGGGLPALARAPAHPLTQRPAPDDRRRCRAATSRRCCSVAGCDATSGCSCSSSRRAASTSGPARRSIGRSGR